MPSGLASRGGAELGPEASVPSPGRHPQGHVSGAPRGPGGALVPAVGLCRGGGGRGQGLTRSDAGHRNNAHLGLRGTGAMQEEPPDTAPARREQAPG